ncbi:hypothetical protein [Taibaiella koreensis]|uniref:hypothetical protein n=1 Tax=Taibaiella koreensis TaxID=1268548 RepID=UPI0013C2A593|nr:hypothetical protein [Taibaiella koreensis]
MDNTTTQTKIVLQLSATDNKPISLQEARSRHLEYLEHGPYVYTPVEKSMAEELKVLHSFSINQDDLELLYKYAEQGIRLHFCREASGNLNIIAAPIGKNGELNLGDAGTQKAPIVNTLEPCPSICAPLFSETSLNCWPENEKYYWMDPNDIQEDKMWFCKGAEGRKEYVDRPESAPIAP